MEKYNIIKLNNECYDYLIIANTYENPINDFLAEAQTPTISRGNILFDLTLINGVKSNRYVSAHIDNSKIVFSTIKPTDVVDDRIKTISKKYFMQNSSLVENSVLPNALKYSLLQK